MHARLALHLLLILALAFNGMGQAMARAVPWPAQEAAAASPAPCHDGREALQAAPAPDTPGKPLGRFPSPAECDGGACRCACLHAATLPWPGPLPLAGPLPIRDAAPWSLGGHAAPRGAVHLRPPILRA